MPTAIDLKFTVRPLRIAVKGIKVLAESTELSASDEIYLIVLAVDLTQAPVPGVRAVKTGVWGNLDTGEFHSAVQLPPGTPESTIDALSAFAVVARPIWPLAGEFELITRPDDVIFLVACMEHDDGDSESARVIAQTAAVASIGAPLERRGRRSPKTFDGTSTRRSARRRGSRTSTTRLARPRSSG